MRLGRGYGAACARAHFSQSCHTSENHAQKGQNIPRTRSVAKVLSTTRNSSASKQVCCFLQQQQLQLQLHQQRCKGRYVAA